MPADQERDRLDNHPFPDRARDRTDIVWNAQDTHRYAALAPGSGYGLDFRGRRWAGRRGEPALAGLKHGSAATWHLAFPTDPIRETKQDLRRRPTPMATRHQTTHRFVARAIVRYSHSAERGRRRSDRPLQRPHDPAGAPPHPRPRSRAVKSTRATPTEGSDPARQRSPTAVDRIEATTHWPSGSVEPTGMLTAAAETGRQNAEQTVLPRSCQRKPATHFDIRLPCRRLATPRTNCVASRRDVQVAN